MRNMRSFWTSVLAIAIGLFGTVPHGLAEEPVKATAEIAQAQFYAALNEMFTGQVDAMKATWSHADDVTYMGPMGGMVKGWADVSKMWEEQAGLKLGGKVEPKDTQLVQSNDLAVAVCIETGENTNAKGEVQQVSIRATNTFRLEGGEWKMIGHHTDLLPYLVK